MRDSLICGKEATRAECRERLSKREKPQVRGRTLGRTERMLAALVTGWEGKLGKRWWTLPPLSRPLGWAIGGSPQSSLVHWLANLTANHLLESRMRENRTSGSGEGGREAPYPIRRFAIATTPA